LFLLTVVAAILSRAIIEKRKIIGRPPVPVPFFILAKILVLGNLVFLLLRGLNVSVARLFQPVLIIDVIAIGLLVIGIVLILLSTFRLNNDLIFGLSSSDNHKLHTRGIYSLSRHPFYLGFIFVLFASSLLNPNYLNFIAFIGAWVIHHFIMINEEEFLTSQYGDEYRNYAKRVKRYFSI
jgi:protein-S-isoprenylcysteine O-methyltransferase Ste14